MDSLVVAKDDRKLGIEVGYGLEGALNDVTAKRIVDEIIVPLFKGGGNFTDGISAGVDRIIRVVDGEPLPAPSPRPAAGLSDLQNYLPVIIILALMVGGFLRALLGGFPGALMTGGTVSFLAWLFVGTSSIALTAGLIAFVFTLFSGRFGSLGILAFAGGTFSGSSRDSGFGGGGGSGSW
ncbi:MULTISPECIES: TPM domain-containing protein [unclassified Bradyrhizobium]|uniref:TPM domain-containing protein n=1 Tax=unclassified Bradyrhizobium TaxID=2631580 RepID=UPI001BA56082|nr:MULTISPECIES: TPM domain-containing protein [unclassified Bradyrhizobium]MBR1208114.1 TPM domain-containing protein [Bradyrhizobium sp. AUGA SZCCT0124]MBR1316477.1 TPM domain-containing protein [Bradyrhizobium sp. AUGA SZCCT0051]MBR1344628.1 TPM domain-containing protein [Bradyrhizobium sp. AUGA SZCCT0105]MBR1359498.1 TPM domain-containing protein [Bradyrhizobium sp. AUGA SZCCT0045]